MKNIRSKIVPLSLLILLMGALAPFDQAQSSSILINVSASPDGPDFTVDGAPYAHAMSAFWPIGSQHSLWVTQGVGYSYSQDARTRFTFVGWSSGAGNPVVITANSAVRSYVASFNVDYLFSVHIACGSAAACASSPGTITANGVPVDSDTRTWLSGGTNIVLEAFPNDGWTFAGWQPGPNQTISGTRDILTVNVPTTVVPIFVQSKTVTFNTSPAKLKTYIDGVLMVYDDPSNQCGAPPCAPHLTWLQGSSHSLAALPAQQDERFNWYIFDHWSDGGPLVHNYAVGSANLVPESVTAFYVPGSPITFATVPGGLSLNVDNTNLPPPYAFTWGIGQTHHVVAPMQQTDAAGGTWTFSKWDDGTASNTRDLTVPGNSQVNGVRWIAMYTGQARLTITSTAANAVTVDGNSCVTPCTITRPVGTQVRVGAPTSIAVGEGSRQDFLGFSVGGAAPTTGDWVGTLNDASTTINANYRLMNRLTVGSNPADAATFAVVPQSADGFYDAQTQVAVTAAAKPGFKFANWSGDLSGTTASGAVTMNIPRSVMASLVRVPYIAPTGVENAAGATPRPGVAPGSVATIFGVNLAGGTEVGPDNPLVQTLAGVIVKIGSRLLPLYFASPTQINLQVPPDLAPGTQTVTISSVGTPDVTADIVIGRNAPGLFPLVISGQAYALVLHEDGSLVTPDSPAKKGELLTLYGTGFGPTDNPRPEGFAIPASPAFMLTDAVSVLAGDSTITPDKGFAIPGRVGVDGVQFRLDPQSASGSVSLHVTISGVDSNTLILPVQ